MGSDVLDASAFYAGIPFGSVERYSTTRLVYDEVRHIKRGHDAVDILVEIGRLDVREPGARAVGEAEAAAGRTGDLGELSGADVSVIALAIESGGRIVTDDYAVSNVAGNLGIEVCPVMTDGIRVVGRWIHYCPGCGRPHRSGGMCEGCGIPLRKKLRRSRGRAGSP